MDTTNSSRELHLTVANEDYLECMVRIESEEGETNGVRSVDIAQRLGVSKASVNKAVSALKASELVEQSHYGKVILTDRGREVGTAIWYRHRLISKSRESASRNSGIYMDTSYYNRFGAEELTRRLSSETLLAQGPMGSVLLSEYDAADIPPAFWNLAEPQTVSRIHRLYVAAGAQVLITNTFQASSYALKHDQIAPSVAEVNRGAVDDARQAHPQLLLGSMGPIGIEWFAEDSAEYREIRGIAREQAHALLNAGVDGLLIETVTSIRNLQPMLAGARDAADGMPVLVSFVVDDKGDLLGDGLNIEAAVLYAEKHGANSVGVNCCSLAAANTAVPRMVASATTPVTVRPNVGDPVQTQDGPVWHENPEAFARACIEWRHAGAAMVGSCCGTTAITTAAMAEALDI